jgi:hypothetical protein
MFQRFDQPPIKAATVAGSLTRIRRLRAKQLFPPELSRWSIALGAAFKRAHAIG